jgi:hypothetical protein
MFGSLLNTKHQLHLHLPFLP